VGPTEPSQTGFLRFIAAFATLLTAIWKYL